MSRGLGELQRRILLRLAEVPEPIVLDYRGFYVELSGVHDLRLVAREMNDDGRGFSDPARQAAFARAVAALVRRGLIEAPRRVPVSWYSPGSNFCFCLRREVDGRVYCIFPDTPAWRRRYVRLPP